VVEQLQGTDGGGDERKVQHGARAECDQRERPQPLDQQPSHDRDIGNAGENVTRRRYFVGLWHSGIIARIRRAKLRRQTSFSLSGPTV